MAKLVLVANEQILPFAITASDRYGHTFVLATFGDQGLAEAEWERVSTEDSPYPGMALIQVLARVAEASLCPSRYIRQSWPEC